jgi:hypothetical protein
MITSDFNLNNFYPPHIIKLVNEVFDKFFSVEKKNFFNMEEADALDIKQCMCTLATAELTSRSCKPDELAKHNDFIEANKSRMVNYISAIAIPVEDVGNPSLALKEYTDEDMQSLMICTPI